MYLGFVNKKRENIPEPVVKKSRFGFLRVTGIVALVIIVMALLSAWWVKHYIYASEFTPTVLTVKEQRVLDSKLARLEATASKDQVVLFDERIHRRVEENLSIRLECDRADRFTSGIRKNDVEPRVRRAVGIPRESQHPDAAILAAVAVPGGVINDPVLVAIR